MAPVTWFAPALNGRLDAPPPPGFFERVAARAREGRFGERGLRYAVEPIERGVRLRAGGTLMAMDLDDVSLSLDEDGRLRYRIDLRRSSRMYAVFVAAGLVFAVMMALLGAPHAKVSPPVLALFMLLAAAMPIALLVPIALVAPRRALERALAAELADSR